MSLAKDDITKLGQALAELTQSSSVTACESRDIACDLARRALSVYDDKEFRVKTGSHLSPDINIVSNGIHIGDQDTLLNYATNLLQSIASGVGGASDALTWFLDGLIQPGMADNASQLRSETKEQIEAILDRHRSHEYDQHIVIGFPNDLGKEAGAKLEVSKILALTSSATNIRNDAQAGLVDFEIGRAASLGGEYKLVLGDVEERKPGYWSLSTRSCFDSSPLRAFIEKDSEPGRMLKAIYDQVVSKQTDV